MRYPFRCCQTLFLFQSVLFQTELNEVQSVCVWFVITPPNFQILKWHIIRNIYIKIGSLCSRTGTVRSGIWHGKIQAHRDTICVCFGWESCRTGCERSTQWRVHLGTESSTRSAWRRSTSRPLLLEHQQCEKCLSMKGSTRCRSLRILKIITQYWFTYTTIGIQNATSKVRKQLVMDDLIAIKVKRGHARGILNAARTFTYPIINIYKMITYLLCIFIYLLQFETGTVSEKMTRWNSRKCRRWRLQSISFSNSVLWMCNYFYDL